MSKTNEALARRWMASKHWGGWRAGMVSNQSAVCCTSQKGWGTSDPVVWADTANPSRVFAEPDAGELPDLDHPGTRAFLLEDVRKAWKDSVYWMSGPGGHHVIKCGYQWFNAGKCVGKGLTEAEALIAALEAAPGE